MKFKLTALLSSLVLANTAMAATAIDLQQQPSSFLQQHFTLQNTANSQAKLEKVSANIDLNQTSHTRIQQTFAGLPVWNATGVVHTPKSANTQEKMLFNANSNSTMNGTIYEGLEKDLANPSSSILTDDQKNKALQTAKADYAKQIKTSNLQTQQETAKKIVFVDENNQAHYAFLTSFYVDDGKTGAHRLNAIIDATSLKVYRSWDQVKKVSRVTPIKDAPAETIIAGGVGGNEKIGPVIYDGAAGNSPSLSMDSFKTDIEILPGQKLTFSLCVFNNNDIIVKDVAYGGTVAESFCVALPNQHNNVAWLSFDKNGTRWKQDEVNGGFSPTMDAFYGATVVKKLYQDWYHIPVLVEEDHKTPMKLIMNVHYGRHYENAYWDGQTMTFGDGDRMFYPLTSIDVTAHEISHGFTAQHSNLDGNGSNAMGGLHESFSDMAAAATQYYLTGKNTWDMGRDIMKGEGALRYMDNPSKDGSSVEHMRDFDESTEVHDAAGIFNKAFYLIATSNGWNTHKAFDIMVKANMDYWTSSMQTFQQAACGVVSATKDLAVTDPSYNVADVRVAFGEVGIKTDKC